MSKTKTEEIIEKIFDYTLEDIMGERFGSYSKYIIQDRAIPDARDGLKPVQRRILYSMYKEKNTYDHGYRKSAKTVGDVIGNYHPHGDSSIYDAMVRMSQPWKTRLPYIDMHGNNGSIDGDSPAAYRYTEARLSKISNEMLRDIDKNTIEFAPNFDDTTVEPTVLPARFPALLVYGAQGISAGYATNIPPHNLGEVIDATIYRIDHPECSLEDLMQFVKGPERIQAVNEYIRGDVEGFQEEWLHYRRADQERDIREDQKRMEQAKKRLATLDVVMSRLYEDYALGEISKEKYKKMTSDYEAEQERLKLEIETTEEWVEQRQTMGDDLDAFIALTKKYVDVTELTQTIVNEYIKKIIIHAPDKSDGKRRQKVEIIFNFVDEVEIPVLAEPMIAESTLGRRKTA